MGDEVFQQIVFPPMPDSVQIGEEELVRGDVLISYLRKLEETIENLRTGDQYFTGDIIMPGDISVSDAVLEPDFNANTILAANADNTPLPLTIAASRIVGRKATGNIAAMTAAETRTVLGLATTDAVTFGDVTGTKFLAGDGAAGTPSYSFTSDTDTGFYLGPGPQIIVAIGGVSVIRLTPTSLDVKDTRSSNFGTLLFDGTTMTISRSLALDLADGTRTLKLSGNLTAEANAIVSQDYSTDSTTVTFAGLNLDFANQDYKFTSRAGSTLAIQSQTSNLNPNIEIYTKDGDGGDNELVVLSLLGKGTPSDITTALEQLTFLYDTNGAHAKIYTHAAGTGTTPDLAIYTEANTTQLVLNTDNSIDMSGALGVTGVVTGGSFITGGNIGVSGDDNLLQLAANALTVNGTVTAPELTLDMTHDYTLFDAGTRFGLQNKSAGQSFEMFLFANDIDGTDSVKISFFGLSTGVSDFTNHESLVIGYGYDVATFGNIYQIYGSYGGTGNYLPIHISAAGGADEQLVLATDGNVSMSGDLGVTGTVSAEQLTSTDDITMQGHLLTLGDNTDTDIVLAFDTLSQDRTITYNASLDLFVFTTGFSGEKIVFNDADTYIHLPIADTLTFVAGNVEFIRLDENFPGADVLIINNAVADVDMAIHGSSVSNLFYSNAGTDTIHLKTTTIGDGGTTNYSAISNTGVQTMHGAARVYATDTINFNHTIVRANGVPTGVTLGAHSGFSLPIYNNDDEELFACKSLPLDYDATVDLTVHIGCYIDTAAVGADKFKLQLSWTIDDLSGHDVFNDTTTDVEVETTTAVDAVQYTSYKVPFTIASVAASAVAGNKIAFRLRRIAASGDEIGGEIVICGMAKKRTKDKLGTAV